MSFKYESISEKLFRDIPLFVEAAKQGSFTLAAEALDIPLPTVSRRIAAMEKALGVPLFYRKTRKIELSEYGQALYERYRYIVDEAGAALEQLFDDLNEPRGPLRFSVHPEVYHTYMQGVVAGFSAQWPGINLIVQFSARWVDLYTEPFDLDIRAGMLPDSDLKVRKLVTLTPALYASPELLKHYPPLKSPSDLSKIPCVSPHITDKPQIISKEGVSETLQIRPAHQVDNLLLSLELALAGAGVIWSVKQLAGPYVESGELVRVLPGWTLPGFDLNVVMASSRIPKRVRLFVDYLAEHFARKK